MAFVVTSAHPWSVQEISCQAAQPRHGVPMLYSSQPPGVLLPQMRGHHASQAASAPGRSGVVSSPVSSAEGGLSKGSISQLQEFVQGAKVFPMPPNCPVLQWSYETRPVGSSMEFLATCSFLLDGVAHHTAGVWRSNKKLAQRDAAERTLGLFVSRWASLITLDELAGVVKKDALPEARSEVELLEQFCKRLSWDPNPSVTWSHRWEDGQCQAFVELRLLDVPHTFLGRKMTSIQESYEDAARRVLWYLQCPGYEEMFEPDLNYVRGIAQDIPEPHPCWNKDESLQEGEDRSLAERKLLIRRVQKRLQQELLPGKPVWYWSYERDMKDRGWPPLFRAHATVPSADRSFSGTWKRGQREAQLQTCALISQFLDSSEVK